MASLPKRLQSPEERSGAGQQLASIRVLWDQQGHGCSMSFDPAFVVWEVKINT